MLQKMLANYATYLFRGRMELCIPLFLVFIGENRLNPMAKIVVL